MKNDIKNLESQIKNKFAQTKNSENDEKMQELQKQLKELKSKLKQYIAKIFGHDILDHILNGQNQKTALSDLSEELSNAIINKGMPEFYLLQNGNQINVKYAFEDLWLKDGLRETFRPNVHIQAINLLPKAEKEIIWDWLIRYSMVDSISPDKEKSKRVLAELKEPKFQEIMQKMAELFTRGQVMRGVLALTYEKYNTAYLKMMKSGINLENNKFLEKIKQETMAEIGKINERMTQNPENFNNYTIYFKAYLPELQFDLEDDYAPIARMRERMYGLIEDFMSDDLMEKIAREMLEKSEKLTK